MKTERARLLINVLSVLALVASLLIDQSVIALASLAVCLLLALLVLYCNLDRLSDLSADNPKLKTLRSITIFNAVVFTGCVALAMLLDRGYVRLTQKGTEYLLTFILSLVMLVFGNICPKLPFTRHTGLRLPWTVRDEQTWIVAHRIIGYIALPITVLYIAATPLVKNYEALFLGTVIAYIGIPGVLSGIFFYRKFR